MRKDGRTYDGKVLLSVLNHVFKKHGVVATESALRAVGNSFGLTPEDAAPYLPVRREKVEFPLMCMYIYILFKPLFENFHTRRYIFKKKYVHIMNINHMIIIHC